MNEHFKTINTTDSDHVTPQPIHILNGTRVPELNVDTVGKLLLKQKRATLLYVYMSYLTGFGTLMHIILRLWLLPFLIDQLNLASFLMNEN